ncbi:chemotaxis protein CheB [Roseateles sp.]|uniref:chemotaxis protein CheB n=1 Tax=Roseateles sp. TaxID=1971397 RepID=UPI003D0F72DA
MPTPAPPCPPPHESPGAGPAMVALGASAGGLVALQDFLAQVPANSGLVYLVVQHLDPDHKPMLAQLLQRVTALPVQDASDGLSPRADAVYVIPPNAELTVAGGLLRLAPPAQPRGQRLPIDLLLSMAEDLGARACGVLLSGMGIDGSLGLQALRASGGLTLAQTPENAQFDSMPRSAIASGCVDIVAPAHELPERLLQALAQRAQAKRQATAPDSSVNAPEGEALLDEDAALPAIVGLLRAHCKHDLSDYKPSTLGRRIQRRMGVHGLATASAYAEFLRQNPQELDLLFKEMLIGVTQFFRDPDTWLELAQKVLPTLLERSEPGSRLRAWVVGCSTGEEAYSLAILFQEALAQRPEHQGLSLQIFASDLSGDAIALARRGFYPAKIAGDMDPALLARYFSPQADGYLINKQIREMVLFAQHDVIQDPPFTKLDLLSCRNLMIYFNAGLQRRLLPLFSYSLRPGGALLLGAAETVGSAQALFTPLSLKSRIFWRSGLAVGASTVDFPINPRAQPNRPPKEFPVSQSAVPSTQLQAHAEQALLQEFSPAAVLVNAQGDVVFINGRVGRFLEPAAGKANWNIHVMAHPAIRSQLAAALRQLLQDRNGSIELPGLELDPPSPTRLELTLKYMREPSSLAGMVMVVFRERAAPTRSRRKASSAADAGAIADLERCREEIHALRQEMGAAAEELQAANEELQSTNEELQSANEELTTSKEESQSMNEELQTLNGELQTKLDDLALAQSDMQNLLNSTDIATLFLDSQLHVRRYTDQITRIVHLRPSDVGRPLTDLASTLIYPELHADAQETLRSLSFSEKEIHTTDGLCFQVRIKPYRTLSNVIQGVVITLIDITAAKALEARLRKA